MARIVHAFKASLAHAPPEVGAATQRSVTLLLAALYAQVDMDEEEEAPVAWHAPAALTFHPSSRRAVLRWALPDATQVTTSVCGARFEVEWQQRGLCGTHCATTLEACADFVRAILRDASNAPVSIF